MSCDDCGRINCCFARSRAGRQRSALRRQVNCPCSRPKVGGHAAEHFPVAWGKVRSVPVTWKAQNVRLGVRYSDEGFRDHELVFWPTDGQHRTWGRSYNPLGHTAHQ